VTRLLHLYGVQIILFYLPFSFQDVKWEDLVLLEFRELSPFLCATLRGVGM